MSKWYTTKGDDGKWYTTQADSPELAQQKFARVKASYRSTSSSSVPSDLSANKSIANAPDRSTWPSGATISAYNPSTAQRISDFIDKLRQEAAPGPEAHTDIIASPVTGLLRALKGNVEFYGEKGKRWQGIKDAIGGTAEAVQLPSLAMVPEVFETANALSNAGKLFEPVEAVAGRVPISLSRPGMAALRIFERSELSGSMPQIVQKFLRRAVTPGMRPLTFKEARTISSELGWVLKNQAGRVSPGKFREMVIFSGELAKALEETATRAGVGTEYARAMDMYRKAQSIGRFTNKMTEQVGKPLLKHAGIGVATVAGGGAAYELWKSLFGGPPK